MTTNNWDTRTALECKLPDVNPSFCDSCRDKNFCDHHRQISVNEWIMKGGAE